MKKLSIHFCERAVKRWQFMDRLLLGKPLSHPFLALVSNGRVISELHMTWSSPKTDSQPSRAKNLEFLIAATSVIGCDESLRKLSRLFTSDCEPINQAVVLSGEHQYKFSVRSDLVKEGKVADIKNTWEELVTFAKKIDQDQVPYTRYAFGDNQHNYQKMLGTVLQENGLQKPNLYFAGVGW